MIVESRSDGVPLPFSLACKRLGSEAARLRDASELMAAGVSSAARENTVYDEVAHGLQAAAGNVVVPPSYIEEAVRALLAEPAGAPFLEDSEHGVMVLSSEGGGSRVNAKAIIHGIVRAAALTTITERRAPLPEAFVNCVEANAAALVDAATNGETTLWRVAGLAGLRLPEGSSIPTPWGVIYPIDPAIRRPPWNASRPTTTCLLVNRERSPIAFDASAVPANRDWYSDTWRSQVLVLLPVALALSSPDAASPIAATVTWHSSFLPFTSLQGIHYTLPLPTFKESQVDENVAREVQRWTHIVSETHSRTIDISARRLVLAIAHRRDAEDALIDAVTVWENLLGSSSEVTFRVTAAMTKLLEVDPQRRFDLRKRLAQLYGIRSRVVHGAAPAAQQISEAAREAIAFSLRILRCSYERGKEWLALSSEARANQLLLGE